MGRRTILNLAGALVLCMAAAAVTSAQDFQRSYNLEAGGTVEIANVSGDINLTGYDGSAVVVNAFKQGRDANLVEVEDLSTQGRVHLRAKYPDTCNCDAGIRFEVRVPRSANLNFDKITTASGNLKAEGFAGRLHLSTASGDVKFSSASGDVHVRLPSNIDANVSLSTVSGDIETNFPIEVKRNRHGSGSRAQGQLGNGARTLKITSASGNVSLKSM